MMRWIDESARGRPPDWHPVSPDPDLAGGQTAHADLKYSDNPNHGDPMTPKNRYCAIALVLASIAAVPAPARSEINEQCLNAWKHALSAHALGERCNWLNADTTQRLKAFEEKQRQCAVAKATPAEAKLKADLATVTRDTVKANFKELPCSADARKFFDGQLGLAK
jgi:hypothetical protein